MARCEEEAGGGYSRMTKRHFWIRLSVVLIILIFAVARMTLFGNLRLSVGTPDTLSYVKSAKYSLLEKPLTRQRLLTTNILYKIFQKEACNDPPVVSNPALGNEIYRIHQPCYENIVLFQNIFSVCSWAILALIIIRNLSSNYSKVLASIIVLAFAYSPPIADWDSVLGSESITYSLFAILLASLIELCFRAGFRSEVSGRLDLISVITVVLASLWLFARDSNVYGLFVLLVMVFPLLLFGRLRKQRNIFVASLILLSVSIIGLRSAFESKRWVGPLENSFELYILPYPARLEYMYSIGMPNPESPDYEAWFEENGPASYARFIIEHPGFVAQTLLSDIDFLFLENAQPYFLEKKTPLRSALYFVADLMHPKTILILFLDVFLLGALISSSLNARGRIGFVWSFIGVWLFGSASAMLFVSYFGDAMGLIRHTMFSIEIYRLMFWVFLLVVVDFAITK